MLGVRPVDRAAASQSDGAGEVHLLARKQAQMVGGVGTTDGLVEPATVNTDQRIATDYPIFRSAAAGFEGFRFGQRQRQHDVIAIMGRLDC